VNDPSLTIEQRTLLASLETRLFRLALSQPVRRISREAAGAGATPTEILALKGLAITEMSARPLDARLMEWICVLPPRHGLLGRMGRAWAMRRTVGPLQLRNGPFGLKAAVQVALTRLRLSGANPANVDQLAVVWHGPATERTACIPYRLVLREAMGLAKDDWTSTAP